MGHKIFFNFFFLPPPPPPPPPPAQVLHAMHEARRMPGGEAVWVSAPVLVLPLALHHSIVSVRSTFWSFLASYRRESCDMWRQRAVDATSRAPVGSHAVAFPIYDIMAGALLRPAPSASLVFVVARICCARGDARCFWLGLVGSVSIACARSAAAEGLSVAHARVGVYEKVRYCARCCASVPWYGVSAGLAVSLRVSLPRWAPPQVLAASLHRRLPRSGVGERGRARVRLPLGRARGRAAPVSHGARTRRVGGWHCAGDA